VLNPLVGVAPAFNRWSSRALPGRALAAILATGMSVVALGAAAPAAPAADSCPNAQFRTGASLELPDCRAYEQVSSVNKRGNGIMALNGTILQPGWSAPGGDAVLYNNVQGPGTDDAARGFAFSLVANRTADGWVNRAAANGPAPQGVIDANSAAQRYEIPDASSENLLFVSASPWVLDEPYINAGRNGGVYLGRGSAMDWLTRPTSVNALPAPGSPDDDLGKFMTVGGSEDLSTSYFITRATLTPEDDDIGRTALTNWALYRWQDGQLSNAGVLPDGSIDPGGSVAAGLAPGGGDASTGDNAQAVVQYAYTHSVSTDGTGVVFVSPDPAAGTGRPPQLYLAREGQATLEISKRPDAASAPVGTAGVTQTGGLVGATTSAVTNGGVYAVTSRNHQVIVFSTTDALTDDAPADTSIAKTYRYSVADASLTYLPDLDRASGDGNGPVFNISDDGSRILYRTTGNDLRLWRDGEPTLTLSGDVGPSDFSNGIGESRFSTDGHTLILMSKVPLAGEPDHPAGGGPDKTEVYRYTEDDAHLQCISCPAPTMSPQGPATFTLSGQDTGFGGTSFDTPLASTRGMTDDGTSVFFTTTSPLSPNDHNITADVYEYKDGATHLLSSGATGSLGDYLLDNSATGSDVFIASRLVLAPSDTDDVYDLYDARVDGGFPPPAQKAAPCDGDACQGPVPDSPAASPLAASVTFVGGGNVHASARRRPMSAKTAHRTVRGSRFTLAVTVPGKGLITASGRNLKTARRTAKRATTYHLHVSLTSKAKRELRKKRRLKVAVKVSYRPSSGSASAKTVRVTLQQPRQRKGR
jgi:hypothetical protein